eukprot:3757629-Prymnesium_polylepis.2
MEMIGRLRDFAPEANVALSQLLTAGNATGNEVVRLLLEQPLDSVIGRELQDTTRMRSCLLYTSPSPRDAHES